MRPPTTLKSRSPAARVSSRASIWRCGQYYGKGEVLEFVPGVIVTQHSGDGKANQYFLRGFNLDHGTDFAITVDGMPVNMRTHAHGQGYSDLNWLIPELVEPASRIAKGRTSRTRATSRPRARRHPTVRPLPRGIASIDRSAARVRPRAVAGMSGRGRPTARC